MYYQEETVGSVAMCKMMVTSVTGENIQIPFGDLSHVAVEAEEEIDVQAYSQRNGLSVWGVLVPPNGKAKVEMSKVWF